MSTIQNFSNYFDDYALNPSLFLTDSGDAILPELQEKLNRFKETKLKKLTTELKSELLSQGSVYTGSAGLALYYLVTTLKGPSLCHETLQKALKYIDISSLKGHKISFLCGDTGPLAIMIVIYYKLNKMFPTTTLEPTELVERLLSLKYLLKTSPDELLYGKVGFLYSLLFVKNNIEDENAIPTQLIKEVIQSILKSGKKLSHDMKSECPLQWMWHEKMYLGAAHGMAGILYMLLQAHMYIEAGDMELIKPTINWLLTQRLKSGNFSSSVGSQSGDKLVQWCHGAPGFVPLFVSAYQVFKDKKYLDAAISCGDVIWERGLCGKGYSLCHGVSGNAYAFLQLYQLTKEPVHLHRACAFMTWCVEERPGTEMHRPDRPASLFEGILGPIYLATDLMDPLNAKFPAFSL